MVAEVGVDSWNLVEDLIFAFQRSEDRCIRVGGRFSHALPQFSSTSIVHIKLKSSLQLVILDYSPLAHATLNLGFSFYNRRNQMSLPVKQVQSQGGV